MTRRAAAAWLACAAARAAGAAAFPALKVTALNVRNARGVLGVLVFRSPSGWPENVQAAFRAKAVPAHPGAMEVTFDDLPPGVYAVVACHDENENKKVDKNFFGVPKEGWGMSNNPAPHLAAPAFERARFELRGDTELRVRLRYGLK